MESYWSKKSWKKRLFRSIPFIFLLTGLIIYKSCGENVGSPGESLSNKKAYQHLVDYNEILSPEDMNILSPLTNNNKISISYPNRLMNVQWDSLSNADIELVFQVAPIRKIFKEEGILNKVDVQSNAVRSVAKGRWGKMIAEYNKYAK